MFSLEGDDLRIKKRDGLDIKISLIIGNFRLVQRGSKG